MTRPATTPYQWDSLLTAYFLAWMSALALFLVSVWLAHYVLDPFLGGLELAGFSRGRRLLVYCILAAGIVWATFRVRKLISGVGLVHEKYRLVVEAASDGILIIDRDGRFEANSRAFEMLGYQPGGIRYLELRGCNGGEIESENLLWTIQELIAGKGALRECRLRRNDGGTVVVEASGRMLDDGGAMAILRDITDRKRAEVALRASERRYRLLFEQSLVGVFRLSCDGVCLDCNDSFARILGYGSGQELTGRRLWRFHLDRDQRRAVFQHLRRADGTPDFEVRLRRLDGTPVCALLSLRALEESCGGLAQVIGTLVDITRRKEAEEQLRALLNEKEVLLKEVHHRVKNNLQVISSLLNLRSASIEEPAVLDELRNCRNQISAIALVHETLYRSKDLATVNFPLYVERIADHLVSSFGGTAAGIELSVRVEVKSLELDTAIPCGLIINELASNALKHAFPGGGPGQVRISMSADENNRIRLTVTDSGIGMPGDFDIEQSETLGMQLVNALTQQLGGVVEIANIPGAEFRITFLEASNARR